jgi:multimeric flavodoxin WrbA
MTPAQPISVVLFNGSPRTGGNTELCLKRVQTGLTAEGIETELVPLTKRDIRPCQACMKCKGRGECVQQDDLNELLAMMVEAQGIVIGSPTWFGSVTSWVKNLIDRSGFVSRMNGHLLRRKVGTPVIAVRRGGAVQVYNEIMSFFAINHFYMVGSSYWNFAFGLAPGEAAEDAEGMATMDDIAANMAFLLKALRAHPSDA